jgi:hypothetical protein
VRRREALGYLLAGSYAWNASAQGVASRGVKALPRGKPSGLPFLAHFTDIAASAGLVAPVIYGGIEEKTFIIETVGCGCAFIDYDNDGWLDIYILSGSRISGSTEGATNRLYKNNRNGTFTDVTEKAGLRSSGWASAVSVGDYNNDGFEDLFVTFYGRNALYRNNGDGTFTDVAKEAGLLGPPNRWNSGCCFVDYDRDGRLDLFVSNYLQFDFARTPKPGTNENCMYRGVAVNCGPIGLPPGGASLYRNNGNGTFTDVSAKAGITKASAYAMTVTAADFDNDGWPDVYVACDSTPSLLFMNNRDGTFREEGLMRGVALNEDGMEQAGMGIGVGDFNLDGNIDLFKTHFSDDTNILYKNDGKANFEDVTVRAGLGVETRFISWGAAIADLDNDGSPDLCYGTGNVYPALEKQMPGYPMKTPRVVFRNLGNGKFEELIEQAGPGIAAAHASRGCALGDFDNDGDLDVLIVNLNEPPSLLRNDVTGGNHWLKIKLAGTKSNRSAIGARVIARYGGKTQAQEVASQSSFYSANDLRLHFGLGAAKSADLEVRWPSGLKQAFNNVPADRIIRIEEGAKAPMLG